MSFDSAARSAIATHYSTDAFGTEAIFSPSSGDDLELNVIIDDVVDFEPGGAAVRIAQQQTAISYQRSDIDRRLKRGETFTVGSTVYTVRAMADFPESWTDDEGQAIVDVN